MVYYWASTGTLCGGLLGERRNTVWWITWRALVHYAVDYVASPCTICAGDVANTVHYVVDDVASTSTICFYEFPPAESFGARFTRHTMSTVKGSPVSGRVSLSSDHAVSLEWSPADIPHILTGWHLNLRSHEARVRT
jgi:hypothetical protein